MSKKKYVDMDEILERLADMRGDLSEEPQYDEGVEDCLYEIEAMIQYNLPSVDVEEVRHGKWIIKNNEPHWQDKDHYSLFITCSECGLTHFLGTTRYANEYNEQKFKDNNYDEYLFCRKCGAKMDKE